MLRTIRSHKFQETVSYYDDDIDFCGCGEWVAPGVGDMSGEEYDIIFDEMRDYSFAVRDIRLHNT